MKKIFTLLFSLGIISAAMAQSDRYSQDNYPGRDNRNFPQRNDQPGYSHPQNGGNGQCDQHNGYGQFDQRSGYGNQERRGDFSMRMRDEQIAKINYDYDLRINSIRQRRGWFFDKNRMIRSLENERAYKIRMVMGSVNDRNGYGYHYNERDNNWRH